MKELLVVLNNWKRIGNMQAVIHAWKNQSVKANQIVVVDNSPWNLETDIKKPLFSLEAYPNPALTGSDCVWRWTDNLGCSAHLAPALMLSHKYRHTLFADDDILPGTKAIEAVLRKAKELAGRFSTIGQIGRNFRLDQPSGSRYVYGNSPEGKCNLTCNVHLVKNRCLKHVLSFRQCLVDVFGDEGERLVEIHDDLLLCLSLQFNTSQPSYTFSSGSLEERLVKSRLNDMGPEAVYKRPGHLAERNRFVDMALEVGWREVR